MDANCLSPSSKNFVIHSNDHQVKQTRGKQKIPIEFINDRVRRYSTFSKRKTGLMKKAVELSELTGAEVLVLVASCGTKHVYTFATQRFKSVIESGRGQELIQSCLNYSNYTCNGNDHDDDESAASNNANTNPSLPTDGDIGMDDIGQSDNNLASDVFEPSPSNFPTSINQSCMGHSSTGLGLVQDPSRTDSTSQSDNIHTATEACHTSDSVFVAKDTLAHSCSSNVGEGLSETVNSAAGFAMLNDQASAHQIVQRHPLSPFSSQALAFFAAAPLVKPETEPNFNDQLITCDTTDSAPAILSNPTEQSNTGPANPLSPILLLLHEGSGHLLLHSSNVTATAPTITHSASSPLLTSGTLHGPLSGTTFEQLRQTNLLVQRLSPSSDHTGTG